MRAFALLILCLSVLAPRASALTARISTSSCPGEPGAKQSLNLDCAGGGSLVVLGAVTLDSSFTDLIALDGILEIQLTNSTLEESPVWEFDSMPQACTTNSHDGSSTIRLVPAPPASGCGSYGDLWSGPGSGGSLSTAILTAHSVRLGVSCYRSTDYAAATGEKLFAFQVIVDMVNAVEAGGSCAGCPSPATISLLSLIASGATGKQDGAPYVCPGGNCPPPLSQVSVNATYSPVLPHSWGQLKALYR